MIEIRTGSKAVGKWTWQVEISWQQRREIIRRRGVSYGLSGGLLIETDVILDVIYPKSLADAPDEETFWNLPAVHHEGLAIQVGYWLWTGREMAEDQRTDDEGEGDDEGNALSA